MNKKERSRLIKQRLIEKKQKVEDLTQWQWEMRRMRRLEFKTIKYDYTTNGGGIITGELQCYYSGDRVGKSRLMEGDYVYERKM